jgi:hypothetical protein
VATTVTSALKTLTQTGTVGYKLVLKNGGSNTEFVIVRIHVSLGAANQTVWWDVGLTVGTLTNNTSDQVFSLRSGSGSKPSAGYLAEAWDEVGNGIGGITAGNEHHVIDTAAKLDAVVTDPGITLPPGTAMGISGIGAGEIAADITFVEVKV